MNVLIIGGYGSFGRNIAKLLSAEPALTFTLAGRNEAKAQAACKALKTDKGAKFHPLKLDRSQRLSEQIKTPPDVIIDATGPFQSFRGDAAERVIRYAIDHKCHYLDLSDDTDFIRIIEALDTPAKAAGITALSGLSTYPVLTSAVLDELAKIMPNPLRLETGIAPSPKANLGKNVLSAILNTAGRKNIYERQDYKAQRTYGLVAAKWQVISVPLGRPLKPLLFAQVDSPEAVFLSKYDSLKEIKNYAGPQPVWMMRLLILLSHLARFRVLPPLRLFAGLFHRLHHLLTYGEHRSGYFVHTESAHAKARFHMTAIGDDGPLIPSMPAAIIIKNFYRVKN